MEYIIIGILILLVVLVTISLFKNINEGNITERLGKLENNVTRDLYDFKNDINKNLNEDINALNDKIELRLNMINDKVNERLDENFEKTNKTFTSVLERLSKIDEAQKKIDTLSNDIVSLQGILTDKKSRGIYGEVNLKHILTSVFGEKNDKIYRLQYTLPNSTIVDAALFATGSNTYYTKNQKGEYVKATSYNPNETYYTLTDGYNYSTETLNAIYAELANLKRETQAYWYDASKRSAMDVD